MDGGHRGAPRRNWGTMSGMDESTDVSPHPRMDESIMEMTDESVQRADRKIEGGM